MTNNNKQSNPFIHKDSQDDPEFSTQVNAPKLDENNFKVPHNNKKLSVDLQNVSFEVPEDNNESPKFNADSNDSPRFRMPINNAEYIPEGGIDFKNTVNKQVEFKKICEKKYSNDNVVSMLSGLNTNNDDNLNASFKSKTTDLVNDKLNNNNNSNNNYNNNNNNIDPKITVSGLSSNNSNNNENKSNNKYKIVYNESNSSNNVSNSNKKDDKKEEIEYARKSHLEYLKLIKDNKDPLGVHHSGGLKPYTIEEISKHNQENDLWMVINGAVFNLTMYLDYHPGGAKKLMKGAGKDATALFNKYHPWVNFHNLVGKLQIGYLVQK